MLPGLVQATPKPPKVSVPAQLGPIVLCANTFTLIASTTFTVLESIFFIIPL